MMTAEGRIHESFLPSAAHLQRRPLGVVVRPMIGAMPFATRGAVTATPVRVARASVSAADAGAAVPAGLTHRHSRFGGATSSFQKTRSSLASRRQGRVAVSVTTRAAGPSSSKIARTNDDDTRPFFDSKEANDITGYANFKSRADLKDAALVDRHSAPVAPLSQSYQQTLRRSFTVCGLGLHSGTVETVRVCPAFANEGRYFVRVPVGTIPDDAAKDTDGAAFDRNGLTDEETEDLVLEQLRSMLGNGDETKDGSKARAEALRTKTRAAAESAGAYCGNKSERRTAAAVELVQDDLRLSTRLGLVSDNENTVGTVEHLLSALEALGVDNARVEVEGTGEVPILDGSAYPFCYHASRVGLVAAATEGTNTTTDTQSYNSAETTPRMAWKLTESITVTEGDAFITLNPDAVTKVCISQSPHSAD